MKRSTFYLLLLLLALLALLIGVTTLQKRSWKEKTVQRDREELVIYSSHPVDFLSPLIKEFEARTGIWVTVISGGTGEFIERIE